MHGWVLLLLTIFLTLFCTETISETYASEYYDRSCSPCGVQYTVSGRSERLEEIARKCGYDVKTIKKYNVNAQHNMAKGTIIRLPCPLGSKATDLQNSASSHVNQLMPFSSSRRLEGKFTVPWLTQDIKVSIQAASTSDILDSGFIGCGICGDTYEPGGGDTIKSVAQYCNTTEDDLKKKNQNLTDDNIASFQAISLSCNGTDNINNCSVCGSGYHIQPLETLFNRANTCNIALTVLEQANLGIDYDNVYPGQYINIPCRNPNLTIPLDACGPCGIEYKAIENVGIEDISTRCLVNTSKLRALNPSLQGPNITTVPIGDRLRLPCGQGNCGPCGSLFTTLDDDDIMSVAGKCHVGTIALQLDNQGVDFTQLLSNTSLKIPCNHYQKDKPICSKCSPILSVVNDTDVHAIARMCNVSTDLIIYANSIRFENEFIPRGTTVYVPCASVPAETRRTCTICGASIKLKAFVKIDALAALCNTTTNAIEEVNPKGLVLDNIGPGDTLMLPCNSFDTGCGPCGISYIVTNESESLQSVAVKCATMALDIQSANPETNFTQGVAVGAVLDIPCSLLDRVSGSGACARCSTFLGRHNGQAIVLLRFLVSKPWIAFVFSLIVLVL